MAEFNTHFVRERFGRSFPHLKGVRMQQFDEWLDEERAAVWERALDHVERLSDPAYTVEIDDDTEIITHHDVQQAREENPFR